MNDRSVAVEPDSRRPFLRPSLSPQKVYESIVDAIFAIDEYGFFQYVSPSSILLLGYTPEEMTGVSFLNYIHPEDVEKTVQIVAERTPDCRTSNFDNRYYRKDGTLVPLTWSGRWDEADRLLYCVARDGSEKLQMEQQLHEAQSLAKIASFEFDVVRHCYTYTSHSVFDLFGLDRKVHPRFTPELFWSQVHPSDVDRLKDILLPSEQPDQPALEYRILCPDGKLIYIHCIRKVLRDRKGHPQKIIGTFQDITDRKFGELALRQSEERFRALVEHGSDMLGILDAQGNYIFVSGNVGQHIGYNPEELLGRNAFEFIHPGDTAEVSAALQQLKERQSLSIGPFRFLNAQGEWRWVKTKASNHLDNPYIRGLVVNSSDITEKKLREDERIKSEADLKRLSLIAQETTNAVIIQDAQKRVEWVNAAFLRLSGYTQQECIGRHIGELCDGPGTDAEVLHYVQQQTEKGRPFRIEVLNYKKNGETYWADVSCQPLFDEAGTVVQFFSIATDITERKALEAQLEREQRERQNKITAATLKAQEHERSVISQELHDNVNQVLTTVKLYTEMVRDGFGDARPMLDRSVQLLQESINEIRSLSKRLSAPSLGKIKFAESVTELVGAVASTNKFSVVLDTDHVKDVEVSQEVHLAVYRILQEHLTNILKHAAAARVHITLQAVKGQMHLKVTDDGKGFDPKQKCSGIGIANMITRAESLGGRLSLHSAPGAGCSLEVSIPL